MTHSRFTKVLFAAFYLVSLTTSYAETGKLQTATQERLGNPALQESILGAIAHLEDTQVRNRPGKGHAGCDATDLGDGAKNEISISLPFRENMALPVLPMLKVHNKPGEWASYVHFLPKRTGFNGRNVVSLQDSNVFMTTFISYPFLFLDDSSLPSERRFITPLLKLAFDNIKSFKRGDAYNFWAVMPGFTGKAPRSGPNNIPVNMIEKLGKSYLNPHLEKFFNWLVRGLKAPPRYWVERCLDPKENPTGADALFNIPNDSDDTATVVAFQRLFAQRFPGTPAPELDALKSAGNFRDIGRKMEDGRDSWKGKNTGAFLTWMKDENEPTFGTPESGIIPLGVNNVDCVVNANVAFSMALNGLKKEPGYIEALTLLAASVEKHAWPDAGLYYPQYMIFPYTVTRAWRDGGAREGPMPAAMSKLLNDLLNEQEAWGKKNPGRVGAFPGGEDRSDHLSTALGLNSLLNIGREIAERNNLADRYDRGINTAVQYLIRSAKSPAITYNSTRAIFSGKNYKAKTWDSGLFFSASFWDLGQWRSELLTVAIVAEGLMKYALAYDYDRNAGGKTLRLIADPTSKNGGLRLIPR